jgi:putative ABC transport system ATP-binding protein
MSIITAKGLTKVYHETAVPVHALNGVDFEVGKGEFTAIVGPSGCGKTTLLNILGGLDDATEGSVHIEGTNISEMKDSKLIDFRLHNIGFVFQSYNLIPVLTTKENIEFIMLLQNRSEQERNQRAEELMREMGIADQSDKRPSELSGGQQQRVAVARALASKPKFVLADEPTANLDSASTTDLLDIMAKLNQEEGITFVFSTHDQRVIDRARRIVYLDDGKIVNDVIVK